ncbi:MAG: zinc metallopeptidase [Planctomycetota bacterium]|nr:MAG: zinc metallopeptidase [Planctomycetota bacterium]
MILFFAVLIITVVIGMIASGKVKASFHRARQVPLSSGLSGAEIARMILRAKDINDVEVVETGGFLSDHYHPGKKQLALSREVYHGRDAAAAGVAAHEVGHALQHAHGSVSLSLRSWLAPAAGFGSSLAPYIIVIGALMGGFHQLASGVEMGDWNIGAWLTAIGIALFGAFTIFTLITVPNEYDASARAKAILQDMGIVRSEGEMVAVRGVLSAAALTYVAAAISAIMWLLYYILPLLLRR